MAFNPHLALLATLLFAVGTNSHRWNCGQTGVTVTVTQTASQTPTTIFVTVVQTYPGGPTTTDGFPSDTLSSSTTGATTSGTSPVTSSSDLSTATPDTPDTTFTLGTSSLVTASTKTSSDTTATVPPSDSPSTTATGTDTASPSESPSTTSSSPTSTPTAPECVPGAELLINGGFDSGSLAPWSQTVVRQQSYWSGVINDTGFCRTGYCWMNQLYDGSVNMLEQTVQYCDNSAHLAYTFTANAKVAIGISQCYLLACINGPRQCGNPIIIAPEYTEAIVHFDNVDSMGSVKLQVYTECIGPSDDLLEVVIDNLSLVTS